MGDETAPANPTGEILELLRRIAAATDAGQAEALDPAGAAKFLSVSVSKIHGLNSSGLIPLPARIGDSDRLPRWSKSELKAWLLAGSPSRVRWAAMRDSAIRRSGAA